MVSLRGLAPRAAAGPRYDDFDESGMYRFHWAELSDPAPPQVRPLVTWRIDRVVAEAVRRCPEKWFDLPPVRRLLLGVLPSLLVVLFRPGRAELIDGRPLEADFGFRITSPRGMPEAHLHIVISGRRCRVDRGLPARPTGVVRAHLATILRMTMGAEDPAITVARVDRVEIRGDVFTFARFHALFGFPTRLRERRRPHPPTATQEQP